MATGKKTIVVYSDWDEYFLDLSDEEAGKLIKHFFNYINDRNPVLSDRILEATFKPIKGQLKRDLDKWETTRQKRVDAGRNGGLKSGESRKNNEANEANASELKQNEANEAVIVNCNNVLPVNESEILLIKVPKEEIYSFDEFWSVYPNKIAKDKCKSIFEKLSKPDKEKIKATISFFINHKPFKEYNHPNPQTYLNQKRWNDEIQVEVNNSVPYLLPTRKKTYS